MRIGKLIKKTSNGLLKFDSFTAVTSKTVADELGIEHKNLMRIIRKAEKYLQSHRSELSRENLNFSAFFQDYKYENERGRVYPCKLMNEDALSLTIKMTDTDKANSYFIRLKSQFNDMKMERHIRQKALDKNTRYTDELMTLREGLFEEGSKGAAGLIATMQRKIHKKATGSSMKKGGVDHNTLSAEEDFYVAKLRSGVADLLKNTMHLTAREARKEAYTFIEKSNPIRD